MVSPYDMNASPSSCLKVFDWVVGTYYHIPHNMELLGRIGHIIKDNVEQFM